MSNPFRYFNSSPELNVIYAYHSPTLRGSSCLSTDLIGSEVYYWNGGDLFHCGLYVDKRLAR